MGLYPWLPFSEVHVQELNSIFPVCCFCLSELLLELFLSVGAFISE